MKFQAVALCLLAGGASAFSPAFRPNKSGLMVPGGSNSEGLDDKSKSPVWRPPQMVAGGAERAAGQEYYEGALFTI